MRPGGAPPAKPIGPPAGPAPAGGGSAIATPPSPTPLPPTPPPATPFFAAPLAGISLTVSGGTTITDDEAAPLGAAGCVRFVAIGLAGAAGLPGAVVLTGGGGTSTAFATLGGESPFDTPL